MKKWCKSNRGKYGQQSRTLVCDCNTNPTIIPKGDSPLA